MTVKEWISGFAALLDAEPPSPDEIDEILDLAAKAAHASERVAAPIACWMAGRSGRSLEELCQIAEQVR